MWKQFTLLEIAAFVTSALVCAAPPAPREVTWTVFQQDNAKLGKGRGATVHLTDGRRVRTVVHAITPDGLEVTQEKSTSQFKPVDGKVLIPREAIDRVQFRGKVGRHGLYGGLIGAGAGAGLGAAAAASCSGGNCEGSAAGAGILIGAIALPVAGYFIGHAADTSIPEYRIVGAK